MNNELNQLLINEIKSKSQIKFLEDEYIGNKLNQFFLTNGDKRKKIELEFNLKKDKIVKSKKFKEILKVIREEIGIVYGSYLTSDFAKKEKILENMMDGENLNKLLSLHKSTRERVDFYDEIYDKIFSWYKPKSILDIACGLNPISYLYFKEKIGINPHYFATDLNPKDMDFLNIFFDKYKIDGIAKSYDVVNLEILKNKEFQRADLVFLFKALDSFEQIKKNISKDLIKGLKAKYLVVSFPTKSLVSKKIFKIEKRNWFFNFLNKEKFEYETFEVDNELFILISKG